MIRTVIFLLVTFFYSTPVLAWWEKEHQVVAIIAEKNLTEAARKQVDLLLDGESLSAISSWADSIKSDPQWAHSKRWHYINAGPNQNFDKHRPVPAGDILWALDYFYQVLQKPDNSKQARREALMFFCILWVIFISHYMWVNMTMQAVIGWQLIGIILPENITFI